MSYTEIEDNVISDGSVITEAPSNDQVPNDETPYYQQYQEQPIMYGDTPLPDYEYQTKRSNVNDFYELGFFTKIFGFGAFAFLCIGLIIWLAGQAALGDPITWIEVFATVFPMCMAIFIFTDKIANAYNSIVVMLLFSICTGIFALFSMITYANSYGAGAKHKAAAAGEFFVFFGHTLLSISCLLSFLGK